MERRTSKGGIHALVLSTIVAANGGQASTIDTVSQALNRGRSHQFHPVDSKSFTIDRNLQQHGIAETYVDDWKVRLVAVRDLVRAGDEGTTQIVQGLRDPDVPVRYVSATALGILKLTADIPDLEHVVDNDENALARSQAVVALGQIESTGSVPLVGIKEVKLEGAAPQ